MSEKRKISKEKDDMLNDDKSINLYKQNICDVLLLLAIKKKRSWIEY